MLTGIQTAALSEVLLNLVRDQRAELITIQKHTKFHDAYRPTERLFE